MVYLVMASRFLSLLVIAMSFRSYFNLLIRYLERRGYYHLLQQHHVNFNHDFPYIVNLTLAQEIIRARKKMNISQQQLSLKTWHISKNTRKLGTRRFAILQVQHKPCSNFFLKSPQLLLGQSSLKKPEPYFE